MIRVCSLCSAVLMAGPVIYYTEGFQVPLTRNVGLLAYCLFALGALAVCCLPQVRPLKLFFLLPGALLLYWSFTLIKSRWTNLSAMLSLPNAGGARSIQWAYFLQSILFLLSALVLLLFLAALLTPWREKAARLWFLPGVLLLPTFWLELLLTWGMLLLCCALFAGAGADRALSPAGETGIPGAKVLRVLALCAAVLLIVPAVNVSQTSAGNPEASSRTLPYFLLVGCALLVCCLPARRKLRLVFLIPGALMAVQYYQSMDRVISANVRLYGGVPDYMWPSLLQSYLFPLLAFLLFLVWILLRSFAKGNLLGFVSAFWFLPGTFCLAGSLENLCLTAGMLLLCYVLFAGADAPKAVPVSASAGAAPGGPAGQAQAVSTPEEVPVSAPQQPAARSAAPAQAVSTPESKASAPAQPAAPEGALFCPRCGKSLTPGAPFCPHCGGKVE